MTTRLPAHIQNLKFRIRTAFTHAYEHFDLMAFIHEDTTHALRSREFRAGLSLLDTLIVDDRFTSIGALNEVCWDLVVYKKQLEEDRYGLKAWEVRELVREIDRVREKEF